MEVKSGPMALQTALRFLVRSCPNFASTTSKRKQAPETPELFTSITRFQAIAAARKAEATSEAAIAAGLSAGAICARQAAGG